MGGTVKKEIAEMWVTALRSKKYTQGKGSLRTEHESGREFCCLGVLCELYNQHNQPMELCYMATSLTRVLVSYNSRSCTLPPEVCKWSGIHTNGGNRRNGSTLIGLNDTSGYSFDQIANVIEEEWEQL
jgi:hypothetical protein